MKKEQIEKLPKGIDQVYVDSLNAKTIDELKAEIVRLQVQNEENETFKESDKYLQAKAEFDMAKERWDLVAGPIRDTTKILKNKTKLVVKRLHEKGG